METATIAALVTYVGTRNIVSYLEASRKSNFNGEPRDPLKCYKNDSFVCECMN